MTVGQMPARYVGSLVLAEVYRPGHTSIKETI
jgi:hypothetical protein